MDFGQIQGSVVQVAPEYPL